jgi:hypothetical protein
MLNSEHLERQLNLLGPVQYFYSKITPLFQMRSSERCSNGSQLGRNTTAYSAFRETVGYAANNAANPPYKNRQAVQLLTVPKNVPPALALSAHNLVIKYSSIFKSINKI